MTVASGAYCCFGGHRSHDLPDRLARNIFLGDWAGNNGFAANLSDFNKTGLNVLVKAAPRARFQLTDFIDFEVPVPKPVLKTEFVLSHG
jgi:hypothetical protein